MTSWILINCWGSCKKYSKLTEIIIIPWKRVSYTNVKSLKQQIKLKNQVLKDICHKFLFSSVQSLSPVWLLVTSWTTALQVSLSIINSQSPPKPMSIESVMHPTILSSVFPFSSCPQSFPASRSFPMSQLFSWGGQSIGVSPSASVLPMNTQDWFPIGWTGWISLQSKGLSRVFSNITVQKHLFFSTQLSL